MPQSGDDKKVDQSVGLQQETIKAVMPSGGAPKPHNQLTGHVTVIKPGQTDLAHSEGEVVDVIVEVQEDVIAEVSIRDAIRPSHVLLFPKGTRVTKAELDRKIAMYGSADDIGLPAEKREAEKPAKEGDKEPAKDDAKEPAKDDAKDGSSASGKPAGQQ